MRPGGINREQASVWGRRQASAMAEGELRVFEKRAFAGVARVAGEYLQRFGGGITTPIRAGWMELSYVFDNAYHVGGFARQHWGSDDYNIQFQNRASYLSVGVMWDVGRLDSLNSDVARTPVSEPRCRLFRAAPS
jgi:hypothetical protein